MTRTADNEHPLVLAKRENSMTYGQLAKKCKVSTGYLRQIGSGVRRPSFPVADDIAVALTKSNADREALTSEILRYPYRPSVPRKRTRRSKRRAS